MRIAPVPPEPLEVWIGGAAPPAIDRAARLGDGFLAGPESAPPAARELASRYRERCDAHGRPAGVVAIRRDVHVAATHDDAARVVVPIVEHGYRGFTPDALVWGSPDEVAEQFAGLAGDGYTDVIVRHLATEQTQVLQSFEHLAAVRDAVVHT